MSVPKTYDLDLDQIKSQPFTDMADSMCGLALALQPKTIFTEAISGMQNSIALSMKAYLAESAGNLNKQLAEALKMISVQSSENIRSSLAKMASMGFFTNTHSIPSRSSELSDSIDKSITILETPHTSAEEDILGGTQYDFGVTFTIEGRFFFERRLIKGLSTNSKDGKYFLMLLSFSEHYVLDCKAIEKLELPDPEKGIGYTLKDLKEKLANNNLEINIHRNKKTGYKLLNIRRKSN